MKTELIVALDFPTVEQAMSLVDILGEQVHWYKVGLELFLNSNGQIISELKARGHHIFLDLKFHDIPNTVAEACRWAATIGVDMINVHALGGYEMMKSAAEAVSKVSNEMDIKPPKLIAVTILTSINNDMLAEIGITKGTENEVVALATLAQKAGLDGVVCSSREVPMIKQNLPENFLTVCPGIRPTWSEGDDQQRILTPAEASNNGVSHIVVGRPIRKAENPALAAEKILAEIS